MKRPTIMALVTIILAQPVVAYDRDDLRRLQFDKNCNGCDLSGADLQGLSLRGAQIRWSNLSNANLNNTDLEKADLTGSDLSQARINQTRFNSAMLQGVQFKGVALQNAQFRNADLRWSKMEHMDIDNDMPSLGLMMTKMDGVRFRNNRRCREFTNQNGALGCIPEFR